LGLCLVPSAAAGSRLMRGCHYYRLCGLRSQGAERIQAVSIRVRARRSRPTPISMSAMDRPRERILARTGHNLKAEASMQAKAAMGDVCGEFSRLATCGVAAQIALQSSSAGCRQTVGILRHRLKRINPLPFRAGERSASLLSWWAPTQVTQSPRDTPPVERWRRPSPQRTGQRLAAVCLSVQFAGFGPAISCLLAGGAVNKDTFLAF